MTPQEQHEYDEAVRLGHTTFLGHYPIHKAEAVNLYAEVIAKNPELIAVGVDRANVDYVREGDVNHRCKTYRRIEIAYKNNPSQVVGSIGYEYEQYVVFSRLIDNAKYAHWNSDSHSKKSKHMKNIVKEAVKYLLPTQFTEIVRESSDLFSRNIREVRSRADSAMNNHIGAVRNVLREELAYMIEIGYTPKHKEVADALSAINGYTEEDNHRRVALSNQLRGIDQFIATLQRAVYMKNRVVTQQQEGPATEPIDGLQREYSV